MKTSLLLSVFIIFLSFQYVLIAQIQEGLATYPRYYLQDDTSRIKKLFNGTEQSPLSKILPKTDNFELGNKRISKITTKNAGGLFDKQITYRYDSEGDKIYKTTTQWNGIRWINLIRERTEKLSENNSTTYEEEWNGSWVASYRTSISKTNNGRKIVTTKQSLIENVWQNDSRRREQYDADSNITFYTNECWIVNDWIGEKRFNWEYDKLGNEVLYSKEVFRDNQWIHIQRIIRKFDDSDNQIEYHNEEWSSTGEYENGKSEYYDEFGKLLFNIWFQGVNGEKTYEYRYSYEYDENTIVNTMQQFIKGSWTNHSKSIREMYPDGNTKENVYYKWNNNKWIKSTKFVADYYEDGLLIIYTKFEWNVDDWVNSYRTVLRENSFKARTLRRNETWIDNDWVKIYEYKSDYDLRGNLVIYTEHELKNSVWQKIKKGVFEYGSTTISLFQKGDFNSNQWVDQSRFERKFDEHGNLLYQKNEYCINNRWVPFNHNALGFRCSEIVFLYLEDSGTETQFPISYYLSQNYPNPFNPTTNIKFNVPQTGKVSLTVYDNLGREVSIIISAEMGKGFYQIEYDAIGLSSGVYFYQLVMDGFVETKKMILIK